MDKKRLYVIFFYDIYKLNYNYIYIIMANELNFNFHNNILKILILILKIKKKMKKIKTAIISSLSSDNTITIGDSSLNIIVSYQGNKEKNGTYKVYSYTTNTELFVVRSYYRDKRFQVTYCSEKEFFENTPFSWDDLKEYERKFALLPSGEESLELLQTHKAKQK